METEVTITQLPTGIPASTDVIPGVDILDLSSSVNGTTKKYHRYDEFAYNMTALGVTTTIPVTAATTAALTATYSNGAAGVGATLTNSGTQAALVIDGVTLNALQRVLVKNQAAPAQNGIYGVTNVGSGSTNWVLTRAVDYNTPSQIVQYNVTLVSQGTVNGGIAFEETGAGPFTIGTTAITYGTVSLPFKLQVQRSAFNYGIDTGVADAYVVNLSPAITALTDGLLIAFTAVNNNATVTPTLTVNGLTANIVTIDATDIVIGEIGPANFGGTCFMMYSSFYSNWMYLNAPSSMVTASSLANGVYIAGTDSGAANAYVVTLGSVSSFAPFSGSMVAFTPLHANTGSSTLVVNAGFSNPIILMNGASLPANALIATKKAILMFGYNSSGTLGWILLNPQGTEFQSPLSPILGGTGTATAPSAGQVLIGTTPGVYTPAAIGSGAGILVANSSGAISISATGGGIGWVSQASTPVTAAINTGYVVTDASQVTFTLPTAAALGSVVRIAGQGAGGWILAPGAGQTININGAVASTSITSGGATDCIEVVCTVANTTWNTLSYVTVVGFTVS